MKFVRFTRLFFIIALAALVGIVALATMDSQGNITGNGMYDKNGMIGNDSDSHSYRGYDQNTLKNGFTLKFSGFYGCDTIWLIDAAQPGQIRVDYDSNIESGRFKVILVSPEHEVAVIAESSKKGSAPLHLKQGEYRLKIVGDNARGNIKASIKAAPGITAELDKFI